MALYSLLKLVALCALVHEAAAFAPVPSACKEGDPCDPGALGRCCSGTRDPPPLKCAPDPIGVGHSCQYDACLIPKGKLCDPNKIGGCCVSGCCIDCVLAGEIPISPPIYWCQPGEA